MNSAFTWRKSSISTSGADCVELGTIRRKPRAIRDSKNPDGPVLHANLGDLLKAVKAGQLDH